MINWDRIIQSVDEQMSKQKISMAFGPGRGFVEGIPCLLLRAEGVFVAIASIAAFAWSGDSWALFAALILAPDLSMLGYFAGARIGAAAYNAVHTYLGPIALFCAAAALKTSTGLAIALI